MKKLNPGFYTALGSPLDNDGNIVETSLRREIDMQIDAGASGLLLMGSMGIEAAIKLDAWAKAAEIAVDAVGGRVPLFVGAMDNSIWRVKERLALIENLDIDGVVLTTPFYTAANDKELEKFFSDCSDATRHPLFLYDLPVVTKVKITYPLVEKLIATGKIAGIKTGDIVLARQLRLAYPDFEVLFSNLDCFDVALSWGIDKVLDGMFSCTPKNSKKFVESYLAGDIKATGKYLNNIIDLRNFLLSVPGSALLYVYTEAMNQLGMDGIFCYDYSYAKNDAAPALVKEAFTKYGEL